MGGGAYVLHSLARGWQNLGQFGLTLHNLKLSLFSRLCEPLVPPSLQVVLPVMKGKGEEHYNDNAANYFILFLLAIITIPSTFVFLKNRFASDHDDSARCACRDCKQKQAASSTKKSKSPNIGTIFKGALLVILWALLINVLLTSTTGTEQTSANYFDPYVILGIETVCIFHSHLLIRKLIINYLGIINGCY